MSFNLQQLTEGIRQRHVGTQNKRLTEKWNRTGLLRGLDDVKQENMSTLLENQAAQVLREANSLGGSAGSSDIRGFANIAFPIVRRVFGGLVANDLVSIQPMSLPSGLLFYLDYTYGSNQGPYEAGQSLYNSPAGKGVQSGSLGQGGQYDLTGTGYSRHYKTRAADTVFTGASAANASSRVFSIQADDSVTIGADDSTPADSARGPLFDKFVDFDPVILQNMDDGIENYRFLLLPLDSTQVPDDLDLSMVKSLSLGGAVGGLQNVSSSTQSGAAALNVRRLTKIVKITDSGDNNTSVTAPNIKLMEPAPFAGTLAQNAANNHAILFVCATDGGAMDTSDHSDHDAGNPATLTLSYSVKDKFNVAGGGDVLTVPSFESDFGGSGSPGDPSPVIPEIDIKIESIPVTAQTRKLRARWSPELAQDLNAYHSMDAEVELTQILSEQIALEIDREILNDLLVQAQGANYYWSRSPGKFVNKKSGAEIARTSTLTPGPAFTGTVREWYETLTETVIDVANEIHRKTLRGSANFIVVSPDVATILESSVMYRPDMSIDGQGQVGSAFSMGAEKVGKLSNRFTVYKDPYFPRNKILVGYKGGSYLETGYVYAPYVPLIVTPTIFAPEDFTPRKGVMTRYGKKMVRADFYGTVTCLDMNII